MTDVLIDGQRAALEQDPFASGAEADLYRFANRATRGQQCAKIYKDLRAPLGQERLNKLEWLIHHPPGELFVHNTNGGQEALMSWPLAMVADLRGRSIGVALPYIGDSITADRLASRFLATEHPRWASLDRSRGVPTVERVRVALNIAVAVALVHKPGSYVLRDHKPENVLVRPNISAALIDVDSLQVSSGGAMLFRAEFETPGYAPPESYRSARGPVDEMWDRFSLAATVYEVILGQNPFVAVLPSVDEAVRSGQWAHAPGRPRSPHFEHQAFERLPANLQGLFRQAFDWGTTHPTSRPTAVTWMNELREALRERFSPLTPPKRPRAANPSPAKRPATSLGRAAGTPPMASPVATVWSPPRIGTGLTTSLASAPSKNVVGFLGIAVGLIAVEFLATLVFHVYETVNPGGGASHDLGFTALLLLTALPLGILIGWAVAKSFRIPRGFHVVLGVSAVIVAVLCYGYWPSSQDSLRREFSNLPQRSVSSTVSATDMQLLTNLPGEWSTQGAQVHMSYSADGSFHFSQGNTDPIVGEWRAYNGELWTRVLSSGYVAKWSTSVRADGSIFISTQKFSGLLVRVGPEIRRPARATHADVSAGRGGATGPDTGSPQMMYGQATPTGPTTADSTSFRPSDTASIRVLRDSERMEPDLRLAPQLPPTHAAVQLDDNAALVAALQAGGDVDERDGTRATPLIRAAWKGNPSIVQLLITHGASVNATDSAGQTALHLAVTFKHPSIVDALLSAGADPNIRAHRWDDSPFFRAILHGYTALALALERHGATLTARDLKLLEEAAKLYPDTVAATLAAVRHRRP